LIRFLVAAALLAASPALADAPPGSEPWDQGVPDAQQKQAEKLFAEGNELFAQQAHAPAIEKYKAALALWDHPLIQFNLAVTLIRLDRSLEAIEHLEAALRYGEKPFKPELYQQALDYEKLLKKQVGYVSVTCGQPRVAVTLDGKHWFDCPGSKKVRVIVGEHTVVGERPEFVPQTRRLLVAGDATASEKLDLVPLEGQYRLVYPHKRWLPWTITAAGGAVALAGLGVWFAGKNQMDEFKSNFARDCAAGCEAGLTQHLALRDQKDSAEVKGTIGIAMMVAGGAATAGGLVFVILNTPKRVLPNVEVVPTSGGMRAQVGWRF
jgi:hypothetical protein